MDRGMIGQENRVAVYCRVSKKDQSTSIDNQMDLAKSYIGMDDRLSKFHICVFEDDGYTGTNMNRPAVKKLLAGIFLGKIQALVVKDFSRLSRDHLVLAELLETVFPRYPLRVVSIADQYDSDHDRPGLENGIKNLFYEYYCRDISNKTQKALQAKRQNGEARPGKCPYGYKKNAQGKLVIKCEEAAVVRTIFRWCMEGKKCAEIAEKLEETDHSRKWSASVVWRILHDPVYTGNDPWHKSVNRYANGFTTVYLEREMWKIRENAHPAIISRQTCEAIRKRYPEPDGSRKKRRSRHMFHGVTKCGSCGTALCRHRSQSGVLICKQDKEHVQVSAAGLWRIIQRIFPVESEKYGEIFLKIFVNRILVTGREIVIQTKVVIENDFIL